MYDADNKSFIHRLNSLISELSLTINSFEKETGINKGTLQKAMKKNSAIGIDKINLITDRFPEVNAGWLVSGQGEMFLNMSHSKVAREPGGKYLTTSQVMARIISTAVSDPKFEEELLNDLDEIVKRKGLARDD